MDRRVAIRAAGVGLGVAALAAGAADPALAGSRTLAHASYVSSVVLVAHPDNDVAVDAQARINALTTWANALAAKIAALPSTKVVVGRERMHLLFKLSAVKHAIARIDAATSASSPLTDTQKAQLTAVAATLTGVVAKLTTILANSPAPAAVKTLTFSRDATFDPTRHHCDGTWSGFGSRDGWTWWGDRDGRHHWWH